MPSAVAWSATRSPSAGLPLPGEMLIDTGPLECEENAGACFLRRDGTVWTTDIDGLLMSLLSTEITATTEKGPGEHYRELTTQFGYPSYTRIDSPAGPEQRAQLDTLSL